VLEYFLKGTLGDEEKPEANKRYIIVKEDYEEEFKKQKENKLDKF
jgi:hypothetical protein